MKKVIRDAQNIYNPDELKKFQKKMSNLIETSKDENYLLKHMKKLEEKQIEENMKNDEDVWEPNL